MLSNTEIKTAVDKITDGLIEPSVGWSLDEAATACVYWCVVHKGWRDGTELGMTKRAAKEQLHNGPLSGRSIGAIEPKVMNVTSVAQKLLGEGLPIYNNGRYSKRTTGEDMGPMVCKGFAPAPNYQDCLLQILPEALAYFGLSQTDTIGSDAFVDPPEDGEPGTEDETAGTWESIDSRGTEPTDDRTTLANRANALLSGNLPKEPPSGNPSPRRGKAKEGKGDYVRDPKVVAWVLRVAAGSCELCRKPAPFISASTGNPYLEVHHVVTLAEGGKDMSSNCVALCPNCHRQCHSSNDRSVIIQTLYRSLGRLERPPSR